MKYIAALLLLLAGCFPALPPAAPEPPRGDSMTRVLNATVAIVDDEGELFCSGVTYGSMVLTAAHCTEGAGKVALVAYRDDLLSPGKFRRSFRHSVSHFDEEQDFAILSPVSLLEAPRFPGLLLAPDAPFYGDDVVVVGHPRGWEYSVTRGIVSHPRRVWVGDPFDGMVWMQYDAGTAGGNSGGPVLNRYGEIVGLVSFGYRGLSHLNGAVHWETIAAVARTH